MAQGKSPQLLLEFNAVRNSDLFSNHWLENRLPLEPEWTEARAEAYAAIETLTELWKVQKKRVEKYDGEQMLEEQFIQPVLRALGWKDRMLYLPMDKADATRHLNKLRRQWFAKRKGMTTLLKEAITKQESKLEDSDSLNKAEDVDDALQELGGDHCSFGDFTLTITVWDEDEQTATEKARAVQQVVDGIGLVSEIEDFNAVQAWMGSLPGHAYADVRRPLVSSLNVCDLVPLSAVWSGPARCAHLDGPPLLVTRTKGSTPFRLSLHQGDVGHTIIAGPTGAGKSTLLNLLACQWLRYPGARVYIFDKGASCRAMTLAMSGDFYDLGGEGEDICFQPLADIDDESELAWRRIGSRTFYTAKSWQ